jgi:hypothetical protein
MLVRQHRDHFAQREHFFWSGLSIIQNTNLGAETSRADLPSRHHQMNVVVAAVPRLAWFMYGRGDRYLVTVY